MEPLARTLRGRCRMLGWASILLAAWTLPANAGFTAVHSPAPGEASHEQILEGAYGGDFIGSGDDLGNGFWTVFTNGTITATRVDDFDFPSHLNLLSGLPGAADDDTWTDGTTVAIATVRFALFPQEFGYDLGAGFVRLIDVTGSGFSVSGSAVATFPAGSVWRWARANDSDAGLINAHFSDEESNRDNLDHMVTYYVAETPGGDQAPPVWLVFWEDLNGPLGNADVPDNQGIPADRDFNDLVIELVVLECIGDQGCDDGDPCSADGCEGGRCLHEPIPGCGMSGRMTGGGSVFADGMRVTHGFELHCDPTAGPNNLQINWGRGDKFHLTSLESAICTDDPVIDGGPPGAVFDTFEGTGMGRLNGIDEATITFRLTDAGEPGKNLDLAEFRIAGRSGLVVRGTLSKGNHQAHRE